MLRLFYARHLYYSRRIGTLVVSKIISCAPRNIASELRLRRPSTVSECVQIVNSLSTNDSFSCSTVNKPHRGPPRPKPTGSNTLCFRCGKDNHLANDPKYPAKNATCRACKKTGHFPRFANLLLQEFKFQQSLAHQPCKLVR